MAVVEGMYTADEIVLGTDVVVALVDAEGTDAGLDTELTIDEGNGAGESEEEAIGDESRFVAIGAESRVVTILSLPDTNEGAAANDAAVTGDAGEMAGSPEGRTRIMGDAGV